MSDRLSDLEASFAALTEAQRRLDGRVSALERRPSGLARRPGPASAGARDVSGPDVRADIAAVTNNLALVGRTLLVLAGAFLLRALTDSGTLPAWMGVGFGFCYAGVWIAMAYRAGPMLPWSAGFHGLSAIAIAYPLLVEATTRFRLLSPAAASATLAFFTAVALVVAARRRLQVLAWLVEIGGILAAAVLMISTGSLAPPLVFLAVVGVSTLWLGYLLDWIYLRWPVAIVTDLAMVLLALRAVSRVPAEGPRTAVLVQVIFIAGYLGSFAARTLFLGRAVVDFEFVQTAVIMMVGLGGASFVTARSGLGGPILAAASIAFGAAAYAVAFAFVERQQRGKSNFYFYSSVALVFVLAGTGLVLAGSSLGLGWAALALVAAAAARALARFTLAVHAAVYAAAAAVASGVLGHAATTVLASPLVAWAPAPAASVAIVAAAAATAWLTGRASPTPLGLRQRIPRCLLIAVLASAAAGLASGWLVPALAGSPGPAANLGLAATVRTGVLVVGVLLLAWGSRFEAWLEAGWLAYPLLVLIGLKLLLEDMARSRPASLFLAFALYGAALILVPRLRRRESPQPTAPAA